MELEGENGQESREREREIGRRKIGPDSELGFGGDMNANAGLCEDAAVTLS